MCAITQSRAAVEGRPYIIKIEDKFSLNYLNIY